MIPQWGVIPARDALTAGALWLAATSVLAVHFGLEGGGRAVPAAFLWVSAHTGGWLLVACGLLAVARRTGDGPSGRSLLVLAAGGVVAAVAQPSLQLAGMRALAGAGVTPVFGTPDARPTLAAMVGAKLPASLFTYAALAAGAHLLATRRRAAAAAVDAARLEAAARAAELKALRAQLHPHFLFNALHSVSALVEEDPPAARRTLARLSDLLRMALDAPAQGTVLLRDELRWVEAYLDVEKARYEERLVFDMDVDAAAASSPVPALLLQPLVENAVRHGVALCESGARIAVRARRGPEGLRIELETALLGAADEERAASGRGLGLDLTRARLELMYARRAVLEVSRDASRHTVVVTLPAEAAPR